MVHELHDVVQAHVLRQLKVEADMASLLVLIRHRHMEMLGYRGQDALKLCILVNERILWGRHSINHSRRLGLSITATAATFLIGVQSVIFFKKDILPSFRFDETSKSSARLSNCREARQRQADTSAHSCRGTAVPSVVLFLLSSCFFFLAFAVPLVND